jgi:hypothetical protein
MKNKKQFDKFIIDIIKKNKIIDDIELQNVFKEITVEEINNLWHSYYSL